MLIVDRSMCIVRAAVESQGCFIESFWVLIASS